MIHQENPNLYPLKTLGFIPCFNAVKFIDKVISETLPYVDELLLFNDGSVDGSDKIMQKWSNDHPNIHYLEFPMNKGKGHALLQGFAYALEALNFDVIITLDADGQHDAKLIPKMVLLSCEGADLVIGKRDFSKMPPKSKHSNRLILTLLKMFYPKAPYDTQSGFRIYSRNFVKELVKEAPGGRYETEFHSLLIGLQSRKTIKLCPIPTIYIENNRFSHFKPLRDSFLIIKALWEHLKWRRAKRKKNAL